MGGFGLGSHGSNSTGVTGWSRDDVTLRNIKIPELLPNYSVVNNDVLHHFDTISLHAKRARGG